MKGKGLTHRSDKTKLFNSNRKIFLLRLKSNFSNYLNQWKTQMTKSNFEILMIELTENIAKSFENYILSKTFHQLGAILLDKVAHTTQFFSKKQ